MSIQNAAHHCFLLIQRAQEHIKIRSQLNYHLFAEGSDRLCATTRTVKESDMYSSHLLRTHVPCSRSLSRCRLSCQNRKLQDCSSSSLGWIQWWVLPGCREI